MLQLGVTVKHVAEPDLGSGSLEVAAGASGAGRRRRVVTEVRDASPLTFAGDVDLTKTPTVNGDVQHVALAAKLLARQEAHRRAWRV